MKLSTANPLSVKFADGAKYSKKTIGAKRIVAANKIVTTFNSFHFYFSFEQRLKALIFNGLEHSNALE